MPFEGVTLDLYRHLPILGRIYFKCVTFTSYLISSGESGNKSY